MLYDGLALYPEFGQSQHLIYFLFATVGINNYCTLTEVTSITISLLSPIISCGHIKGAVLKERRGLDNS